VTFSREDLLALACAQEALDEVGDAAKTDRWRDHMRTAAAVIGRVLERAFNAQGDDCCEHCYVERARIVRVLNEQLLDESRASTPGGDVQDIIATARDLGYRAGWNDRARSLVKGLQS